MTIETLCNTLTQRSKDATFTCGGTLTPEHFMPAPRPLFIQYEGKSGGICQVNFPMSQNEIETLAANCDPTTFGGLKEEKLDIDYRSAWKLDESRFLTSFHPAETDIIEVIKKILLPGAINNESLQSFIIAERYKLNVRLGLLLTRADIHRYTKGQMTNSSLMSIHLAR